jgi:hypothetical protein
LATAPDGKVFLIEGKAHFGEMASTCQARDAHARRLIIKGIAETKAAYGVAEGSDWLSGFYQYANRLAHLNFLRKHGVAATLVFVYFMGDKEMRGPSSQDEWESYLTEVHRHLSLTRPIPGVVNAFIPVDALPRSLEQGMKYWGTPPFLTSAGKLNVVSGETESQGRETTTSRKPKT